MLHIRLFICFLGLVLPNQLFAQRIAAVDSVADDLLREFDQDGDGKLDASELRLALASLSDTPLSDKLAKAASSDTELNPPKFIRVQRDKRKRPITLDTSIVTYKSPKSDVQVDLIGAVHIADKSYYTKLNRAFKNYDVVLYELVAPEGTRIPEGGGESQHPLGKVQQGMKGMLELEFQLEQVDYQAQNLVHADMSPEEFAKSMKDRNESFLQMLFRMMGQASAKQSSGEGPSDFDMLFAFFAKDRARRLKQAMAVQFEDIEGQMKALQGPDGSTIITERNKKALEVLREQITAGKKKIGIFYGAGHLPDMSKRLVDEFNFKPTGENWITAWDMSKK